jgi:aspartyl aminopeptidase
MVDFINTSWTPFHAVEDASRYLKTVSDVAVVVSMNETAAFHQSTVRWVSSQMCPYVPCRRLMAAGFQHLNEKAQWDIQVRLGAAWEPM